MRQWRIAAALAMLAATAWTVPARADALRIDWLERQVVRPPVLSNMEKQPATLGLDGARLSVADINTTGKFTGMTYQLVETVVPPEGDFLPAAKAAIAGGARVLVVEENVLSLGADVALYCRGLHVGTLCIPDVAVRQASVSEQRGWFDLNEAGIERALAALWAEA